jgi:hypothetical protein
MTSEWIITTATVRSCSLKLFTNDADESTYIVSFDYFVNGSSYSGRYTAGTLVEPDHQFEISYDPDDPRRNSGTDPTQSVGGRIFVWIGGACLAAIIIYLSGKYGFDTAHRY